jgi:hypothetical protein
MGGVSSTKKEVFLIFLHDRTEMFMSALLDSGAVDLMIGYGLMLVISPIIPEGSMAHGF